MTISTDGSVQSIDYISSGGAYTVNPADLASEPVSGGGLVGATVSLEMGTKDLSITTPGAYSKGANGLVSPGSTNGSGSGQKIWITYGGPADIHIEDSFYTQIQDNSIGSSLDWNGVTINANMQNVDTIFLRRNLINSNANDGVFVYGNSANQVSGVFVQDQNNLNTNVRAGVEFFQNINGSFIDGENIIYANSIGIIADIGNLPQNSINDVKIRGNDIDSSKIYTAWFHGVGASMYQDNWSNGGLIYCTLCTNINFDQMNIENPNGGLFLLGSVSIEENGSIFSGPSNAITIGPYQGVASRWVSATGNLYTFGLNGTKPGVFATFMAGGPPTDDVTIGAQLQGGELYTSGTLPAHLKTQ